MASSARILANQANAQLSTGPRTEGGKSTSRQNALMHGLTAKQLVLPHESAEEYNELREALFDSYAPATTLEVAMVELLCQSQWRFQRAQAVETAFLADRVAEILASRPELDPDQALARMFIDPKETPRLRLIMRYLSQASRAFYKAMSDLEKTQKERRRRELQPALSHSVPPAHTVAALANVAPAQSAAPRERAYSPTPLTDGFVSFSDMQNGAMGKITVAPQASFTKTARARTAARG